MSKEQLNDKLTKVLRGLSEIRDTLFECSKDSVIADAGSEWHTAEALFNLAKSADLLRLQITNLTNNSHTQLDAIAPPIPNTKVTMQGKTTAKSAKKRKEDYPKFSIRSDSLVKIGLGRDKRTEYEQIVPKAEYEKIVLRLSSMTSSHKEFVAEDVQEGLESPMYQTYNVLSLLRQTDLLDLPRRGIYSFHSPKTFSTDVKAVWGQIKTQA